MSALATDGAREEMTQGGRVWAREPLNCAMQPQHLQTRPQGRESADPMHPTHSTRPTHTVPAAPGTVVAARVGTASFTAWASGCECSRGKETAVRQNRSGAGAPPGHESLRPRRPVHSGSAGGRGARGGPRPALRAPSGGAHGRPKAQHPAAGSPPARPSADPGLALTTATLNVELREEQQQAAQTAEAPQPPLRGRHPGAAHTLPH